MIKAQFRQTKAYDLNGVTLNQKWGTKQDYFGMVFPTVKANDVTITITGNWSATIMFAVFTFDETQAQQLYYIKKPTSSTVTLNITDGRHLCGFYLEEGNGTPSSMSITFNDVEMID